MPKNVKARIGPKGQEVVVEAHFEDSEWDALTRFVACARRLDDSGITHDAHQISVNIAYADGRLVTKTTLPPDEAAESFLLRMRPILLKREATHFPRVLGHLKRRIENPAFRECLDSIQADFNGAAMHQSMRVFAAPAGATPVELTSDIALDLWLNSEPYHGDLDKRSALEALHGVIPLEVTKAQFYLLLRDKALAALRVANIILVLDGQQEAFEVHMRKAT